MDDCRIKTLYYFRSNRFQDAVNFFRAKTVQANKIGGDEYYVNLQLCIIRFEILLGQYKQSLKKLKDLYQDYQSIFEENKHSRGMLHFLRGSAMFYLGKGGKIKEEAREATKILYKERFTSSFDLLDYCLALLLKGKSHWHYRDLLESFQCFVQALKLLLNSDFPEIRFLLGKSCGLMGVVLLDMNQVGLGKRFLNLGLSNLDQQKDDFSKSHLYKGIICSDLALASLKDIDTDGFAYDLEFIEKCIKEAEGIFTGIYGNQPHRYLATIKKHQSRLLRVRNGKNWKQYASEILGLLGEELRMREQSFQTEKHRTYARIHNIESNIYTALEKYDDALTCAQKALYNVSDLAKDSSENPEVNPSEQQLVDHIFPTEQLKALYNKGRIYLEKYYRQNQKTNYLILALDSVHLGISYIKSLLEKFNSDEARMVLIEQTRHLHEVVVELLLISYQLKKKGINLPTKLQAKNLYETIQHNKSFLFLNLINNDPGHLKVEEKINPTRNNRSLLGTLENLCKDLEKYASNRIEIQSAATIASETHNEIKDYLTERNHDTVGTSLSPESLAYTQNGFHDEDAGILSYFMGRKTLIAILVTKEDFYVQRLLSSREEINALKEEIKNFHHIVKEKISVYKKKSIAPYGKKLTNPREEFIKLSNSIYQKVLEPIQTIEHLKRLYIIPDRELWFVPFEALVTERSLQKEYHKLSYFIDKNILISYHFSIRSISYLYNKSGRTPEKERKIERIVFTSGVGNSQSETKDIKINLRKWEKTLSSIPNAEQRIFNYYFNSKSDIESFLNFIQNFDAVIFGAHGSYRSKEHPMIRLDKWRSLNRRDIKKAGRLDWELLVLYTCFSGEGILRTGEGLMTLCRAFFEQHVQNIVYSLYMVNSRMNKKVMKLFFQHLVSSQTDKRYFAEALFAAKQEIAHKEGATPTDWAGLLFIGDQKRSLFD